MLCKPHLISPAAFPPLSGTRWLAECPSSLQGQPPWSSPKLHRAGPCQFAVCCTGMCTFLAELAATSRCPGRLSWYRCCSSLSWSWALLPGHFPGLPGHFPGFPGHLRLHLASEGVSEVFVGQGGAPSPRPQGLDGYQNPADDVPTATAAPCESPPQQVQQPPATA